MRPILACCALVCSGASLPAHGDTCPAQTADEASAQVQAAFAAWNEAVVQKDLEKTMAIFSQSLRFQVQGSPDFGYPRLLANYSASYARENAPQWQGFVESVISSPQMVSLFTEWKLLPEGGGDPIKEYRGVDVFQRESDCAWRVVASLNYVDGSTIAGSPGGYSPGPATVDSAKTRPRVAWREPVVRDLDFVFGHH
jgi:ketosteroid isomerase-like protein